VVNLFFSRIFFNSRQNFIADDFDILPDFIKRHTSKIQLGYVTLLSELCVLIENFFNDMLRRQYRLNEPYTSVRRRVRPIPHSRDFRLLPAKSVIALSAGGE